MDIFTEKFRPKTLDDVKGQDENIQIFKHFLKTKNIPNLLLYGPKGSGKSSTILSFCRDLYGENYKDYILELNASHDRGINDVRKKIKLLAKLKTNGVIPYKVIILDEADSMTKDAMFALRMIMEEYSKITKFCLICNYPYKIIPPIISRCISLYFKPILPEIIYETLKNVPVSDTNDIDKDLRELNLKKIIHQTNGDMRKSLLLYQYDIDDDENNITDEIINTLWYELKEDELEIIYYIYNQCYKPSIVTEKLLKVILKDDTLSEQAKSKCILFLSKSSKNILDGGNLYINYINLCVNISKCIKK
jgi:DNA polymerase III delta prime subunit